MSDSLANTLALGLDDLLDEIAAAWEIDRDYRVAVQLAATHPEHADEIYAFLDRLVDTATAPTPSTEAREHIARELRAAIAEDHAPAEPAGTPASHSAAIYNAPPQAGAESAEPLIDYAVEATGLRPSQIAERLDMSVSFLDDVNTYPDAVPLPVRAQIVDLAEARLELDRARSQQSLNVDPRRRMAACRHTEYHDASVSFAEILSRSGMSDDQLRRWSNTSPTGSEAR